MGAVRGAVSWQPTGTVCGARAMMFCGGLVASLAAANPAVAQQPQNVQNARVRVVDAETGLELAVAAGVQALGAAGWIAYEVPLAAGAGDQCCCTHREGNVCHGTCALEGQVPHQHSEDRSDRSEPEVVRLEQERRLRVLLRVRRGRIHRVRMVSTNCAIDAGGLAVLWIRDVAAPQSVSLMVSMVNNSNSVASLLEDGWHPKRVGEAIGALSLHAGAVDALIDLARRNPSSGVRGQAIFWLAQRAGERAAATIRSAVDNDPDQEVKVRAVFGLSLLPPERGVPLLIQVVRTNRIPEVRRTAVFWLGRSEDPRALDFIEELLRGP